jgi:hypothetical protein
LALNCGLCYACSKFTKTIDKYVVSWVWNTRCHEKCCPNEESEYCKKCENFYEKPEEKKEILKRYRARYTKN